MPLMGGVREGPPSPLNASTSPMPLTELLLSPPPDCAQRTARAAIVAYADGYTGRELGPFVVSARRFMPADRVDVVLFSNVDA